MLIISNYVKIIIFKTIVKNYKLFFLSMLMKNKLKDVIYLNVVFINNIKNKIQEINLCFNSMF